MSQLINNEELAKQYIGDLKGFVSSLEGQPLSNLRKAALERLESLGVPTNKWEDWKYTHMPSYLPDKLNLNLEQSSDEAAPLGQDSFETPYVLYFHNGIFQKDSSNIAEGIEFTSEVDKSLEQRLIDEVGQTKNPFKALNCSSLTQSQILTLFIPKDFSLDRPILIRHHYDEKSNTNLKSSYLNIEVSAFSQIQFIEHFTGQPNQDQKLFSNHETRIHAQESSKVTHVKVSKFEAQTLHHGITHSTIKKSANVHSFTFTLGGGVNRHQLEFDLDQDEAHCHADGLFATKDSEHVDNFSFINHQCAHTTSSQLFKGILDDTSRGVFTGKVFIARDAQKVDAEQLNKNLLLNNKAKINTRPQLEVYADDVKCAHGATIGQISEDELFYLQSRGIPQEKAYQMLCHAFVCDVIMRLERPEIEKWLQDLFYQNFEGLKKMPSKV